MFSKMRRVKENPKQETVQVEDDMVRKVENLEELVSKRTAGLEETREQLEKLSDNSEGSEGGENKAGGATDALFSHPGQPAAELSVEVEKVGESEEETGAEKPGKDKAAELLLVKEDAEETKESEDEEDSLKNLFSNDEEEVNPLAGLINSLPDVTASELLNEAQEIKIIVRERRHR